MKNNEKMNMIHIRNLFIYDWKYNFIFIKFYIYR